MPVAAGSKKIVSCFQVRNNNAQQDSQDKLTCLKRAHPHKSLQTHLSSPPQLCSPSGISTFIWKFQLCSLSGISIFMWKKLKLRNTVYHMKDSSAYCCFSYKILFFLHWLLFPFVSTFPTIVKLHICKRKIVYCSFFWVMQSLGNYSAYLYTKISLFILYSVFISYI